MRQALNTIAEMLIGQPDALMCNWSALRFQHTTAIRAHLIDRYQPATVNKMLSALRGVLKAAWLLGLMHAEDYHKATTINSVKNQSLPAGRELGSEEIQALLATCYADDKPAGTRDAALIALLYTTGLRRSEIVQLNLSDYNRQQHYLIVKGKGRKHRLAWLNDDMIAVLDEWLALRGEWAGPLFCPINKAQKIVRRRLSAQAVYYILTRRSEQIALEASSPHDLRRTFVSNLLDAGADLAVVSQMAGHTHVQTTLRYDRRPETAKQRAANLLPIPTREDET